MAKRCTIILCMTLSALACSSFQPSGAQGQTPETTTPQFEVTSVKEVKDGFTRSASSTIKSGLPDRFATTNVPLFFIILYAYDLPGHQLVGAPDWTWDRSYDVVGTYPGGRRPPANDRRLMVQQLLADRFGLKVHREQRDLTAYDLIVARKDGRLGPQLHKSDMNCAAWIKDGRPKQAPGPPSPVSASGARPVCDMLTTRKWMTGGARTMQDLAGPLGALLDRPVADKTGLTASYDIDLQWAPTDLHAEEAAGETSSEGPSLFTALEEQLGLKLVAHKEKFDVVVVDAISPPSPN